MKRVEYIPNLYNLTDKFVLKQEYNGFGIYEEICPTGYRVHQSYLIKNSTWRIAIPSYNNMCLEEVLDAIDSYVEDKKFGLKLLKQNGYWVVHPSGEEK